MANATTVGQWTNADGLQVLFGQYFASPYSYVNRAKNLNTFGATKQLEVDVDLTVIPTGGVSYTTDLTNSGTVNGFNEGDPYLPANCSVIKVTMVTKTPLAGGTSFVVGTFQQNGTAISANSLVTATEGVTANFSASGVRTMGAGALTSASAGTAGVGTNQAFIGVTPTGTFTAGTIRLVIDYVDIGV